MTHDAIARLRTTGAKLPTKLREEILALGTEAIPQLIALLENEESWNEKSPGEGWPPIHAVELLADLKAVEAIEPMLHAVVDTDWSDVLHDRIIQRLPEFGPDVFERVMTRLDETADPESRRSLCVIAARLGVRDPELFDILRDEFIEDETFGSMLFYDYGDPAALPDVLEAIEHFEPNFESLSVASDLTELVETYEHLGGVLPGRLRERNDGWFAKWQLRRDRLAGSLVHGAAPQRRAQKVGRNDPCPCGSGKKFKKCCVESRERSPVPNVITRDGDELVTSGDVSPEHLAMARKFFAEKDAGRGPAQQMVDYIEPLLEARGRSGENLQKALDFGMLLWNAALLDAENGQRAIDDMADEFEGEAREAFERIAHMMIERHRTMFPELHRELTGSPAADTTG